MRCFVFWLKIGAASLQTARAALQTHQRTLRHRRGPPRIFRDEWTECVVIPIRAMLEIEPGMEVEIANLALRQPDACQTLAGNCGASRSRFQCAKAR